MKQQQVLFTEMNSCESLKLGKSLIMVVLSGMTMKCIVREIVKTSCFVLIKKKLYLTSTTFSIPNTAGRTYGIPSVRTDLPLPNPRRVSDKTNYGDSSTARALLTPSIYTLNGVHEEHFNCTRSKAEVRTARGGLGDGHTFLDSICDILDLAHRLERSSET